MSHTATRTPIDANRFAICQPTPDAPFQGLRLKKGGGGGHSSSSIRVAFGEVGVYERETDVRWTESSHPTRPHDGHTSGDHGDLLLPRDPAVGTESRHQHKPLVQAHCQHHGHHRPHAQRP